MNGNAGTSFHHERWLLPSARVALVTLMISMQHISVIANCTDGDDDLDVCNLLKLGMLKLGMSISFSVLLGELVTYCCCC